MDANLRIVAIPVPVSVAVAADPYNPVYNAGMLVDWMAKNIPTDAFSRPAADDDSSSARAANRWFGDALRHLRSGILQP
ncbi:hypothetical protein [Sphingomonas sp.]|uniref:hypothetical protein n=1 Tax=Sphingomonas sp. TaxID=28214 RepID=UPI003B3AD75F